MGDCYLVYGARGAGSVAVEAALTLARAPYQLVERADDGDPAAPEAASGRNPLRQVPAVILPSDELITESAAILIHLAEAHPKANLGPAPGTRLRPRFLRWMSYISAQIYALYWIRDDLSRLAADPGHEPVLGERTAERIRHCWAMMEAQVEPEGHFLLGEEISVLDLYMAVVSRWGPRRRAFYEAAPRLGAVARRVDADPRLEALWAERFPFDPGWEG